MRRIFEIVGGFALIAFSFYFTDRVSLMVAGKSELMQEIKAVSSTYETKPVDAVIDNDTNSIIPGKFGKVINTNESYLNMHDFGSFNENYLIFDYIKPNTSLLDHKEKFISQGNASERFISIIIENNEEVENYFITLKSKYNVPLGVLKDISEYAEIINTAVERSDFNKINAKLNEQNKICMKDKSNLELCQKNSYYLIDPKLKLTNANFSEVKTSLSPGSIILIPSGVNLETVKLLMNEIKYKDLTIVHISQLVDEKGRQ